MSLADGTSDNNNWSLVFILYFCPHPQSQVLTHSYEVLFEVRGMSPKYYNVCTNILCVQGRNNLNISNI